MSFGEIICDKHGEMEGGWCFKEVKSSHGVGFWETIRNLWELVSSRISFSVGNGRRIKLCDSFLSLFALSNCKEA